MALILTQSSTFEKVHIPAGVYDATLAAIKPGQVKNYDDPTKMDDVIWWTFEIAGKTKTIKLDGKTSQSFGQKSKAYEWCKNMLGNEPPVSYDLEELVGKPCKITVIDKTSRQGEKYSWVQTVLPAGGEELPF